MIIKEWNDSQSKNDLDTLSGLLKKFETTTEQRKKIEQEMKNIVSGMKAQNEMAYQLNFHFKDSKNYIVLHDIRLEHEGLVAQIDHLIINRCMDVFVCESKNFAQGVRFNEQLEFSSFFNGKSFGMASPIEQNKRHIELFHRMIKDKKIAWPTSMIRSHAPSFYNVILVGNQAKIDRPKNLKLPHQTEVMKGDQFKSWLDKQVEENNASLLKVVSQETLMDLGLEIKKRDQSKSVFCDWEKRWGLTQLKNDHEHEKKPDPNKIRDQKTFEEKTHIPAILNKEQETIEIKTKDKEKKKYHCAQCQKELEPAVAKFCFFNKEKMKGQLLCRDHQ